MRKLIATSLIAVSMLGLAACAKSGDTAAGNAADTSLDAGNTTDDAALGNDVTAVDDGSALTNASNEALPSDADNAIGASDNASGAGGNSL